FYTLRINVVRRGIDVTKHRGNSVPSQRVSGGHKSEGRKDHLAGKADGFCQNFKTDCGVTYGNAMLHIDRGADALLKFAQKGAVIGQPLSVQEIVYSLKQRLAISDVRSTHM